MAEAPANMQDTSLTLLIFHSERLALNEVALENISIVLDTLFVPKEKGVAFE